MATQHTAPEELVERVQDLLGSLDEIADPVAQARVQELVGTVLELYGAGLERILGVIADAGEGAVHIRNALLDDGVVASLLLIHGLYPVSLEERDGVLVAVPQERLPPLTDELVRDTLERTRR